MQKAKGLPNKFFNRSNVPNHLRIEQIAKKTYTRYAAMKFDTKRRKKCLSSNSLVASVMHTYQHQIEKKFLIKKDKIINL